MEPFNVMIQNTFNFLIAEEGFSIACNEPDRVVMRSSHATLKFTYYNARDGFQADLESNELAVSLILLMRVLQPHADTPDLISAPSKEQAQKIADYLLFAGSKLLPPTLHLMQKLSKLCFWHAGELVRYWGTGIILSSSEQEENHALIRDIAHEFKK